MAGSAFLFILGLLLLGIGVYIIKKPQSGAIGPIAGFLILLGIYLVAVGIGIVTSFFL